MQTSSHQQYHGSHSLNGGGGGGAGGSGGQVTTNGTVNPALVASASTSTTSNNNPRSFSPDEDYNLARVILDQVKKHPGYDDVRWDKVEKKLRGYGRREEEWEGRWDGLRKEVADAAKSLEVDPKIGVDEDEEAWTPADDSLLLAAAKHFTSHHLNPTAGLSILHSTPSFSAESCVAWIVTRERTRLGSGPSADAKSGIPRRSLASCHARYVALRTKLDSVRDAYAAPHALGQLSGAWTLEKGEELAEKLLEAGANWGKVDGGWEDERERVGKWVEIKNSAFMQRSVLDLVSKWDEMRVVLLADQLEEAMPDPNAKPPKRKSTSPSSKRKKRAKTNSSDPASPKHAHEPWTSTADADLRRLHAEGNNWSAIAHELGRTKGSVTQRWQMYKEQWKEKGLLPSPTGLFAATPSPSTHNGDILVNSPLAEGEEAVDELDEGEPGDEEEEESEDE